MGNLDNVSSNILEKKYSDLREDIIGIIKNIKDSNIKFTLSENRINQNQVILTIKDDVLLNNTMSKLKNNQISFKNKGNKLFTTVSGAGLSVESIPSEKALELFDLEEEIKNRVNNKYDIDTFIKLDIKEKNRWIATGGRLDKVYCFKSISELEDILENGYKKSTYQILNLKQWRFPTTRPRYWELPNTMEKGLLLPKKENELPVVRGWDDLEVAIYKSGVPISAIYAYDYFLAYPLLCIGYVNAGKMEISMSRILDDNIENKRELRQKLIESIIREINIKEEIKSQIDGNIPMNEKSKSQRLLNLLNKETKIRKDIIENAGGYEDNISQIRVDSLQVQKEIDNTVSQESIKKLSDNKFYKYMCENGNKLSKNPEEYSEFIKNLASWKKESDKTFFTKFKRYIEAASLKNGLMMMLTSFSFYEVNEIPMIAREFGTKLPPNEAFEGVIRAIAENLTVPTQAAIMVYAISRSIGGLGATMELNKWIQTIDKSKIIDKETKGLIKDYIKGRRKHIVVGECLGNSIVSAGQLMMILGGPVVALGIPIAAAGSMLTIGGSGITIFNQTISNNKFKINNSPNKKELEILNDSKSLSENSNEEREDLFLSNLRWKMEKLKTLSKEREADLLWMNIYSVIIKKCEKKKLPQTNKEYIELSNIVTNSVKEMYKSDFNSNMRDISEKVFKDKCTQGKIIENLKLFFENRSNFYSNISRNLIEKSDTIIEPNPKNMQDTINNLTTNYNKTKINTKDFEEVCKQLKENGLWDEAVRKLLKRLIIAKKTNQNIRGSYYGDYVRKINIEKMNYIELLSISPLKGLKFRNYFSPREEQNIYVFKEEEFFHDFKNFSNLEQKKKKIILELVQTLIVEPNSAIGRTFVTKGDMDVKSDVYRPLWKQIPYLAFQEQLNEKLKSKNIGRDI